MLRLRKGARSLRSQLVRRHLRLEFLDKGLRLLQCCWIANSMLTTPFSYLVDGVEAKSVVDEVLYFPPLHNVFRSRCAELPAEHHHGAAALGTNALCTACRVLERLATGDADKWEPELLLHSGLGEIRVMLEFGHTNTPPSLFWGAATLAPAYRLLLRYNVQPLCECRRLESCTFQSPIFAADFSIRVTCRRRPHTSKF